MTKSTINKEDALLMCELAEMANELSDGHLTICKFTTNWAISFETPSERSDIYTMIHAPTFEGAAFKAMQWAQDQLGVAHIGKTG